MFQCTSENQTNKTNQTDSLKKNYHIFHIIHVRHCWLSQYYISLRILSPLKWLFWGPKNTPASYSFKPLHSRGQGFLGIWYNIEFMIIYVYWFWLMFWYMQVDIPYMDDMGTPLAPHTCHWQPLHATCPHLCPASPPRCLYTNRPKDQRDPCKQSKWWTCTNCLAWKFFRTLTVVYTFRKIPHPPGCGGLWNKLFLTLHVAKQTNSNTLPLNCELMHDLLYPSEKDILLKQIPEGKIPVETFCIVILFDVLVNH